MGPIRTLAALVIAGGGLALSTTALAAPIHGAAVSTETRSVVLVGQGDKNDRGRKHDRWREGNQRSDDDDRQGDRWRRDGRDWDRQGDRDRRTEWDRHRHGDRDWDGDRDRHRHGDRDWDNDRDRHRHGDRDWDRDWYRHYGWERGNHYGWDNDHKFNKHKYKHWRARHHHHHHWIGRPLPRVQYVIIHDYQEYYLPPPRYGHYYARVDNDVFLVAEAGKKIIDAFVLLDAAGR